MDGTANGAAVVDQVFLTPRVLDARAFQEYSATLQELLKETAGRQDTLRSASSEVESLRTGLRDAATELQRRLETAVRVIPGIDQRLARAEQLVLDANRVINIDPAEKVSVMQNEARRVIAESMAELETKLTGLLERSVTQTQTSTQACTHAAGEQISRLESDAARIAMEFESRIRGCIEQGERRLTEMQGIYDSQARLYDDRLSRRGEDLEARLTQHGAGFERALTLKLGEIESRLAHFETQLGQAAERQATAAVATVIERASYAEQQALETISQTMTRLQAYEHVLLKRIEHAATSSEHATKTLRDLLDQTIPRLEHGQTEAETTVERLGLLLTTAREFIESSEGGGAVREFRQIAQRLSTIRADADFAFRQFEHLTSQADFARSGLGQAIIDAATNADRVLARTDEVTQRTQSLEARLVRFSEQADRVERLAAVAETAATRTQEFEDAAARLDGLMHGIEQKKNSLEGQLRRTGSLLDSAETMLASRYNQLAGALEQGSTLGETLQNELQICRETLSGLKQQQTELAGQYTLAHTQLVETLGGPLSNLLLQSQDAATRLEAALLRAEELARVGTRSQPPVTASSLFPTAR